MYRKGLHPFKGVHRVNLFSGIHTFNLKDGMMAGMISDPEWKDESFQRVIKHCVPKRTTNHIDGYRISCTFRVKAGIKVNNMLKKMDGETSENTTTIMIKKPNCAVKLYSDMLTRGERMTLHAELKRQMEVYGEADITKVSGKIHTNRGRKVLDLGYTKGQTYTYSGKTTTPGQLFGPAARLLINNKIAPKLGISPDKIWAHVVFYPNATTSLGWHGDSEDGINPHVVLSLTLLEKPDTGIRPFQVRRNDYPRIKRLRTKMDPRQKKYMDAAMSNEEVNVLEEGMPDSPNPMRKKLKRSSSITEITQFLRNKQ